MTFTYTKINYMLSHDNCNCNEFMADERAKKYTDEKSMFTKASVY